LMSAPLPAPIAILLFLPPPSMKLSPKTSRTARSVSKQKCIISYSLHPKRLLF
jgi:hypothetical protein